MVRAQGRGTAPPLAAAMTTCTHTTRACTGGMCGEAREHASNTEPVTWQTRMHASTFPTTRGRGQVLLLYSPPFAAPNPTLPAPAVECETCQAASQQGGMCLGHGHTTPVMSLEESWLCLAPGCQNNIAPCTYRCCAQNDCGSRQERRSRSTRVA